MSKYEPTLPWGTGTLVIKDMRRGFYKANSHPQICSQCTFYLLNTQIWSLLREK